MSSLLRYALCKQALYGLLAAMLAGGMALAADPFHRRYTASDGLPDETLYSLHVAQNGLLWIGTDRGLVCYNGLRFAHIPMRKAAQRAVTGISQGADGTIWCYDFSKRIYSVVRDTLQAYPPAESLLRTLPSLVDATVIGSTLWVCSHNQLLSLSLTTGEVVSHLFLSKAADQEFFDIKAVGGKACVLTENGVYFFGKDLRPDFVAFPAPLKDPRMGVLGDKAVLQARGEACNVIIEATPDGQIHTRQINMPPNVAAFAPQCALGTTWTCSNAGALRHSPGSPTLSEVFFPQYRVADIASDAQGNCWIATLGQGLLYVPHFSLQVAVPEVRLPRLAVLPDGQLCAGSSTGDLLFFTADGTLTRMVATGFKDDITFLLPDPDGKRLFCTFGWLAAGKPFTRLLLAKDAVPDGDSLLMATHYDAHRSAGFDRGPARLAHRQIRDGRSRAVARGPDGMAYIAFADQLMAVDPSGKMTALPDAEGNPVVAYDLLMAGDTLWAATSDQGVLAWKGLRLLPMAAWQQGFRYQVCQRLFHQGMYLWVVCDGKLSRIQVQSGQTDDVSGALGLPAGTVLDVVCHAGRIWLATTQGLLHIPEKEAFTQSPPLLALTAAWRNGHWFMPRDGQELPPGTRHLRLRAGAIHFANGSAVRLFSRLKGYDNQWQEMSAGQEMAEYLGLPPGTYTWQIRAVLGQQPPVLASWTFRILPFWWQTAWFTGVCVLLGLAGLFGFTRWQIGRVRAREATRQALVASQLTALRAQMNPHFMYNVLNSVQGFIYANRKNDASEYLGRFSDLMRKILDNSAKQNVSIKEEWDALCLYAGLEQARFGEDTQFNFFLDPMISEDREIPSMIIQPLVENAIKHGLLHKRGSKMLSVKAVQLANGGLQVVVDDNGIGREAARERNLKRNHTSAAFATTAIASRLSLLNRFLPEPVTLTLTDKLSPDGQPAGTTAILYIPPIL